MPCPYKIDMISIEGNIGAGKSTLCRQLRAGGFFTFEEPVVDWTVQGEDGTSHSVLTAFYRNPVKYACTFQQLVLRTRVEQAKEWKSKRGFVERCVHSDRLFGAMQYRLGNMDPVEYGSYLYQFRQAVQDMPTPIVGHIYLKTSVDTCLARIAKRKREGEQGINRSYLSLLEEEHESWLVGLSSVLVLDGEKQMHLQDLRSVIASFESSLK